MFMVAVREAFAGLPKPFGEPLEEPGPGRSEGTERQWESRWRAVTGHTRTVHGSSKPMVAINSIAPEVGEGRALTERFTRSVDQRWIRAVRAVLPGDVDGERYGFGVEVREAGSPRLRWLTARSPYG